MGIAGPVTKTAIHESMPAQPQIAIVDDDRAFGVLVLSALAKGMPGAKAKNFESPEGFLEYTRGLDPVVPAWDAVILDFSMPGIDGIELCRLLRTMYEDMALVMVSGASTMETVIQAFRAGIDDFVQKKSGPEVLEEVVARTRRAIASRAWQLARRQQAQLDAELLEGIRKATGQDGTRVAIRGCSYCKRVEVNGHWIEGQEEMLNSLRLVSHGICAPCTEKHFAHLLDKSPRLRAALTGEAETNH